MSAAAVAGLTTISPASAVPSISTTALGAGTGDDELTMGLAYEEEVEQAAVDADGHAERNALPQHGEATDHAQRPAHLHGRQTGSGLVGFAGEVHEERVTAELEQTAAVRDGKVEERDEAGVDGGSELLGARLPQTGQALGELCESRNVDEGDGALEFLVRQLRCRPDPFDGEAREVGRQGMTDVGRDGCRRRIRHDRPGISRSSPVADATGLHIHGNVPGRARREIFERDDLRRPVGVGVGVVDHPDHP